MYDKYLVTGATGFLGRAVAEELVRRKAQVHALVPLYRFATEGGTHRHW